MAPKNHPLDEVREASPPHHATPDRALHHLTPLHHHPLLSPRNPALAKAAVEALVTINEDNTNSQKAEITREEIRPKSISNMISHPWPSRSTPLSRRQALPTSPSISHRQSRPLLLCKRLRKQFKLNLQRSSCRHPLPKTAVQVFIRIVPWIHQQWYPVYARLRPRSSESQAVQPRIADFSQIIKSSVLHNKLLMRVYRFSNQLVLPCSRINRPKLLGLACSRWCSNLYLSRIHWKVSVNR